MSQWETLLVEAKLNHLKTEWDVWKDISSTGIGNACLLSMGIDPHKSTSGDLKAQLRNHSGYTLRHIQGRSVGNKGKIAREWNRRFDIAMGRLANEGGDLPTFEGRNGEAVVRLAEFGAWAKNMDWELPKEFPIGKPNDASKLTKQEPKVTKGKPETLRNWMTWVITEEKGLCLNEEMPMGMQAELISRASKFGYVDASAVKRASAFLKLEYAKK